MQTLDINQMQEMHIDQIVGLYRQGYRLSDNPMYNNPMSDSPVGIGIKSLGTCPTGGVVQKGSTKNIKVDVTTAGTPPYTFKVKRGDTEILTYTGGAADISKTWPYTFNEALGTYTYKGFVTDSCAAGSRTSAEDTCTITLQETPPPPPPSGMSPIIILLGLGLLGYVVMKK